MKLNRRKFFAAAAGAAAAPATLQESITPRLNGGIPVGYGSRLAGASTPGENSNYVRDRIAQLRRQLNGEFTADEERQFMMHIDRNAVAVANLDSLKSMSMSAKRNALNQIWLERHRKDWLENAKRELEHLAKQALGF